MRDQGYRFFDAFCRWRGSSGRPSYHDHGNAEGAGGGDLAVGGLAAAIARDDEIDATLLEKTSFIELGERPAIDDVLRSRQCDGRIDRINATNDVRMLRLGDKRLELPAPDRKEDDAWRVAKLGDGLFYAADIDPGIAGDGLPRLPLQHDQRQTDFSRCQSRIARDVLRERVRGIDENVDSGIPQKPDKSFGPSEPADAHFTSMLKGCFRAAGERERDLEVSSRHEPRGEKARFGCSAQNENMPNGHALF